METNPYAAPRLDSDLQSVDATASAPRGWFAVGNRKLWVLSLLTVGIYLLYWFERQYRFQKRARGDSTRPVARAMFSIYANDLFKRVESAANGAGIHPSWSAGAMATLYIASVIVGRILDKASEHLTGNGSLALGLISVATVTGCIYSVAQVQGTVNGLLEREQKNGDMNEHFTVWNWLASAVGVLFWAMMLLGFLFMPEGEGVDAATPAVDVSNQ